MSFIKLLALSSFAATFSGAHAALTRRVACPDGVNTASNAACCSWFAVRDDLQENLFSSECGQEVRESLRLTFHDGIAFSPTLGGGGADGSIITFADTELTYAANGGNGGVEDIVDLMTPFVSKWNVTPGDLIYFAGAVGTSNCPGAPRLQFFTGRANPVAAAPDNLVSQPGDSVDTILARFADAGFSSDELVALLASHSLAAADSLTAGPVGAPFDSTPRVFDSQFFVETRLTQAVAGEVRLPSDDLLARDDRTSCTWQSFIDNQDGMRSAFAAAMTKLSLVNQPSNLIDCSEVIPEPPTAPSGSGAAPYFPGASTLSDVDAACTATPFPTLTQNAAVTSLAPV
ncbi:hypothetical protein ACEPAG_2062 [Sanghuangporus baumii]